MFHRSYLVRFHAEELYTPSPDYILSPNKWITESVTLRSLYQICISLTKIECQMDQPLGRSNYFFKL